MIKDYFEVPDVEHPGDIEYFKGIIQDAGGIITGYSWSGDDGDSCYIFYGCSSREELEKKYLKLKRLLMISGK